MDHEPSQLQHDDVEFSLKILTDINKVSLYTVMAID